MDPKSEKYFNSILKKSLEELTEIDKVFLMARREYLKPHQKEEYKSVLNPTPKKGTVKKKNAQEKK